MPGLGYRHHCTFLHTDKAQLFDSVFNPNVIGFSSTVLLPVTILEVGVMSGRDPARAVFGREGSVWGLRL
jgi:hypothetical protein